MIILACYSNKGGVGKTASAVNLAYACAEAGQRTLLCDLDPQGASGFYFRVKPSKKLQNTSFFEDVKRFTDAIRASDFDNLDILPANASFRDFDVFLSRMKNSRSRLKKALKAAQGDYDVVILDCPPNLSTLSEAVFKAAHHIVVPVMPTTLSERTFLQLIELLKAQGIKRSKLVPFFSMVEQRKRLHADTKTRLVAMQRGMFLQAEIPFSTDVEKMGVQREPVLSFAKSSKASRAYGALYRELSQRVLTDV